MIGQLLKEQNLPPLLPQGMKASDWPGRRTELLDGLAKVQYGVSPPAPPWVKAETLLEMETLGGKALHRRVRLSFPTPAGEFAFPVDLVLPYGKAKPLVLHISFLPFPGGLLTPVEEIVDNGYAVALFCCNDVTEDGDDGFTSGVAGHYPRTGPDAWGKLAMWAWGASRVMDHLATVPEVDQARVAVVGMSRLGKAALWCAAQDERFAAALINESGSSGAALARGKTGETVESITKAFPHWFCENFAQYGGRENEMPFDQHWLLAAVAPRLLCVGSAEGDLWSDPQNEFLGCAAASEAWELLGLKGLLHQDSLPQPGDALLEGKLGYHMRKGSHFFTRQDWHRFLAYLDRHMA